MALLVELSGEQRDLASHEALSASCALMGPECRVLESDGQVLVLDRNGVPARELAARLGLSRHVSDQAVSGNVDEATELAASVDIGEARSFRVRVRKIEGSPVSEGTKALEATVGRSIRRRTGAKVDLVSPEAEVRLVLAGKAHAGLLGGSVDRKALESRAVRHRPFSLPVSIHPKFARAMVNLTRLRPGDILLDPFCGTGGILIEAALMGLHALGSDIDPRMVDGTRQNVESMGLEADLGVADVAYADPRDGRVIHGIVTDPPYGRSTSLHDGETSSILGRLYSMSHRALDYDRYLVVCLPSLEMLPGEDDGFTLEASHPVRVHKSLTRYVCVLRRGSQGCYE